MAEKKKMSVAEILAAARKGDNKGGEAAPLASEGASAAASVPEPAAEAPVAAAAPAPEPAAASAEQPAAQTKPVAAKPAATGGARPSIAEIMKLARQGDAKSAAPKPEATKAAAKPAAAKPAPKPAVSPAAAKTAEKPGKPAVAGAKDTASILAAARKTDRPGPMSKSEAAARLKPEPASPVKAAKPTAPPMPAKPSAVQPKPKVAAAEDRRGFLSFAVGSFLGLGFTSLSATVGLWTLGTARFMFPNVLIEPPSKFKVGFPGDFAPGMVEEKFKAQFGVWVVKAEYQGQLQVYALRTVCTHLGCTPNWLEGEQKFKCPCHGSGFYKDGVNFEGPAPRPLERYAISLSGDGQLEIDKSKTFQEEMGQWKLPECFVPV
jgi:cytochrome b6-f complex iron-sulfur subunit